MKIKLTFTDELLGTVCANPELHEEFIASKSADKEKIEDELKSLPADELMEKTTTVFYRNEQGDPILKDYQIRGFIKEFFKTKTEFGDIYITVGKKKYKFSKWTYGRLVDNHIFVYPRDISLVVPVDNRLNMLSRSIRAKTPRGERNCLGTSESAPEGTSCEFEVVVTQPELAAYLEECFDFGRMKGVGQWRNSGKGRFTWEEVATRGQSMVPQSETARGQSIAK